MCLRLALVQKGAKGDKSRNERIFTQPQSITVGRGPDNTFRVEGVQVPDSFEVLRPDTNGAYTLRIAGWMKGWVDPDGEGFRLDLNGKSKDSRFVQEPDGITTLALTEEAQGKLVLEGVSLLFQFIENEQADSIAPQLAAAVQGIAQPPKPSSAEKAAALKAAEDVARAIEAEITTAEAELARLQARLNERRERAKQSLEAVEKLRQELAEAQERERREAEERARLEAEAERRRREAEEQAKRAAAEEAARLAEQAAAAAKASSESAGHDSGASASAPKSAVPGTQQPRARRQVHGRKKIYNPFDFLDRKDAADDSKDHGFIITLAALFLLNFGIFTGISMLPDIEEPEITLEDLDDRFAQLVIPDKPKDEEPPPQDDTSGDDTADDQPETKVEDAKESKPAAAPAAETKYASTEAKRAAVREGVQGKGLLKLLGALGGGGDGGDAIQDVLGGGSSTGNDIASALAGASGVGVATSEAIARQAGQRLGGGTGEAASIGDLGTTGGATAQATQLTEKKVISIKGRVIDEGPEVDSSSCDRTAIARFVKARMRSIQNCYERELKKNPTLKGKIVVRFTINETGKVTEFEIEEETIGNSTVVACIRSTIRGWRFPIKDNECPVAYPFIFTPSGS